jgi:transposase
MRGPKPLAITLSVQEQADLKALIRRRNVSQQIALRARSILAASEGHNNAEVAREWQVNTKMVRHWRLRWLGLQAAALEDLSVEERLSDAPRPGRPAEISAEQVCRILGLACEAPSASERPISHWSGREIADEIVKRGIVEKISPRHASRLLKKGI